MASTGTFQKTIMSSPSGCLGGMRLVSLLVGLAVAISARKLPLSGSGPRFVAATAHVLAETASQRRDTLNEQFSGDASGRGTPNYHRVSDWISASRARELCAAAADREKCTIQQLNEPLAPDAKARSRAAVIGVLAQGPVLPFVTGPDSPELRAWVEEEGGMLPEEGGPSYIAASYVKFIQASGSKAMPVPAYASEQEYRGIFDSIDALILPGGEAAIDTADAAFSRATRLFFEWAVEANDSGRYFPIMAICLGFESMLTWASGRFDYFSVDDYRNLDRTRRLSLQENAYSSRLFGNPGFPSRDPFLIFNSSVLRTGAASDANTGEKPQPAATSLSNKSSPTTQSHGSERKTGMSAEPLATQVQQTSQRDLRIVRGSGRVGEDGSGEERLPLPSVEEASGNQGLPRRLLHLKSAKLLSRDEPMSREELAGGASRESGLYRSPFFLPDGSWRRDAMTRDRLTLKEGVQIKIPDVQEHQEAIQGGPVTETRFIDRMIGQGNSRKVAMPREDGTERALAPAGCPFMEDDTQALNEAVRPGAVIDFLMNRDASYFHHHKRMTRAEFEADKRLSQAFKLLATSFVGQEDSADREEIVAIVEARRYPFYGFQFHPEKPLFEHNPFSQIPHNMYARIVSMYFSAFLGNEAAKSSRAPSDPAAEWPRLFGRFTPYSTSSPTKSYVFEEVYLFPPDSSPRILNGEPSSLQESVSLKQRPKASQQF
ncbi:gamma-glutamyl hydrolase [Cystoisospora suis]|uniref:folate gamma-glutamyl hydrolase n=1 Tax=Cystoisospora suis TaxID=483139 RepID=A0A2C6LAN3_9APIC|nr:gamma-glutamyl hydrolase [Cystoisospora suis]